jgi:hypothetical protein
MHVLGLLLIDTNLGYGTVLMAGCACQGCSASDLIFGLSAAHLHHI